MFALSPGDSLLQPGKAVFAASTALSTSSLDACGTCSKTLPQEGSYTGANASVLDPTHSPPTYIRRLKIARQVHWGLNLKSCYASAGTIPFTGMVTLCPASIIFRV
jgi:hypothetical protein